jgi:hypothetical protein
LTAINRRLDRWKLVPLIDFVYTANVHNVTLGSVFFTTLRLAFLVALGAGCAFFVTLRFGCVFFSFLATLGFFSSAAQRSGTA